MLADGEQRRRGRHAAAPGGRRRDDPAAHRAAAAGDHADPHRRRRHRRRVPARHARGRGGVELGAALAAVDEATRAGLRHAASPDRAGSHFAHALVRETLLAALPPGERSALHADVARALRRALRRERRRAPAGARVPRAGGGPAHPRARRRCATRSTPATTPSPASTTPRERGSSTAPPTCATSSGPDDARDADVFQALGEARMRAGDIPGGREALARAAAAARRLGDPMRVAQAALAYAPWGLSPGVVEDDVVDAPGRGRRRARRRRRQRPRRRAARAPAGAPGQRAVLVAGDRPPRPSRRRGDGARPRSARPGAGAEDERAADETLAFVLGPEVPRDLGPRHDRGGRRAGRGAAGDLRAHRRPGARAQHALVARQPALRARRPARRPPARGRVRGARRATAPAADADVRAAPRGDDARSSRAAGRTPSAARCAPASSAGAASERDGAAAHHRAARRRARRAGPRRRDRGGRARVRDAPRRDARVARRARPRARAGGQGGRGARRARAARRARLHRPSPRHRCGSRPCGCSRARSPSSATPRARGRLYELLEPYADRNVVSPEAAVFGPGEPRAGRRWPRPPASAETALAHLGTARRAALRIGRAARRWRAPRCWRPELRARATSPARARPLAAEAARTRARSSGSRRCTRRAAGCLEDSATSTAPSPRRGSRGQGRAAILRREGDVWAMGIEGALFRVRDAKGLVHLAQLLPRPRRGAARARPRRPGRGRRRRPRASPGASQASWRSAPAARRTSGPILDAEAKRSYRDRADELRDEIEEAESFNDPERAARAREELAWIAEQLTGAVGLGGRDRRTGSDAERARVNVTRAIRAALRRVQRARRGARAPPPGDRADGHVLLVRARSRRAARLDGRSHSGALRRGRRRERVRRLGHCRAARGGGPQRARARAGQGVPAGQLPADAVRARARVLGPERGPARPLRRVVVPPARLDRELRPRRRLAHLRQRDPAPPGVRGSPTRATSAGRSARRTSRSTTRRSSASSGRRRTRGPTPRRRRAASARRRTAPACGWREVEPRRQLRRRAGRRARGRASRSTGPRTLHGMQRSTCRRCGECDVGCNFGAKNTLDHTYLTRAHARGRRHPHAVRRRRDRAGRRRRRQRRAGPCATASTTPRAPGTSPSRTTGPALREVDRRRACPRGRHVRHAAAPAPQRQPPAAASARASATASRPTATC